MGDSELSGNIARSYAIVGQFDDALPDHVGKRTTVDKDAAQLIDTAVTCPGRIVHYT